MKKLWLASAAVLLAVCAARADVLYWQVAEEAQLQFDEAVLYAFVTEAGSSGAVSVQSVGASRSSIGDYDYIGTTSLDLSRLSGEASAYSFYVECVTYAQGGTPETKQLWTWSYQDLASQGYIDFGNLDSPTAAASGGANMATPAPEPSGGLLMLVGGALLALRRRRA